jgi:hypothetical protein
MDLPAVRHWSSLGTQAINIGPLPMTLPLVSWRLGGLSLPPPNGGIMSPKMRFATEAQATKSPRDLCRQKSGFATKVPRHKSHEQVEQLQHVEQVERLSTLRCAGIRKFNPTSCIGRRDTQTRHIEISVSRGSRETSQISVTNRIISEWRSVIRNSSSLIPSPCPPCPQCPPCPPW